MKVRKWHGETETETSFLKFTGRVIERNEATFCTVHLLRSLSQPDLQSDKRRKKTNRSVSCIWLAVGRLVTKQISTTRWPRLHLESTSRSIQLLTYFCALIISLKQKINFTRLWSELHMKRGKSKKETVNVINHQWNIYVCLHVNQFNCYVIPEINVGLIKDAKL
jgi:hypothetical protein